jgi:hypothetical protein
MIRTPPIPVWLCLTASMAGQDPLANRVADLLPSDARIIETASVPVHTAKTRVLVLWMNAPGRVISAWDSAADFLYGDHWFGPTFLSLIDPSNTRLINTIRIRPDQDSPDDDGGFAVPFFTYDGPYYVPRPDKDRRGIPLLLHLRDLTGEGVAGQFALFDHVASGIAAGSVLGYSSRSDTAVQYPVESTQNKFNPVVKNWAVQVFGTKPSRAGYWKFTWEAGHGDFEWIDEEVRFDPARQLFVEKMTTRPYPGFAQVHCDLDTTSVTNFLGRMQKVAQDEKEIQWLQGLIGKTTPNSIGSAGMVPTFNGSQKLLDLTFQVSNSGAIGIDFKTDSDFAAALQAELKTWCSAN